MPVDADAALAISPAMHRFLQDRVKPLATALFQRGKLLLDYDDSRTRTAAAVTRSVPPAPGNRPWLPSRTTPVCHGAAGAR